MRYGICLANIGSYAHPRVGVRVAQAATDARVRAELLDEGLERLRRLWSGEEVTHAGSHFTVDGVTLAPEPVQERVPIWIGGNRPASLRRAARWDGWLADSADPN